MNVFITFSNVVFTFPRFLTFLTFKKFSLQHFHMYAVWSVYCVQAAVSDTASARTRSVEVTQLRVDRRRSARRPVPLSVRILDVVRRRHRLRPPGDHPRRQRVAAAPR